MSRKRLPKTVRVVLDEKLINLIRLHQFYEAELGRPQKKAIYVSSMLGEQSDLARMMIERLLWAFNDQFPRSKFLWGSVKKHRTLPDRMPKKLQLEAKRYAKENGLPFP